MNDKVVVLYARATVISPAHIDMPIGTPIINITAITANKVASCIIRSPFRPYYLARQICPS